MDRHRSGAPGTKAAPPLHEEDRGLLGRWPGIDDLLHEALLLPPDQRDDYLAQACGTDLALRREILSLIKADEDAGDFLVQPIRALRISSAAEPSRLAPFTVLVDRYRIVRFLGRGGMGEVYRADDLKLDEPVALKLLPRRLAQEDAIRSRFMREVKVARRVTHPNVCRVYDIGEGDGHHFLSMEFIDGEDLASRLRRLGRPPRSEAMEILRQVCRGLAAIHDQGILHCDLKPANLLIDGQGRTRITDFGIAQLSGRIAGKQSGDGTPAYMAPEQHAGEDVSTATDIYALGLVAYELLTGERAFRGGSAAELSRLHRKAPPRPPSSLVADFDRAVERMILSCLAKDPRERPASVADVAASLDRGKSPTRLETGFDVSRGIQALRQLPTPPADFTGRAAELSELRTAVRSSGITISGLQGMGGVGKTTLALKLAEELAPRYPDAHIYLDLRGTSPDPLTPSQVMAHVIRAYYPAAPLPGSEEGIAAHYQSVLHDRRALLLMDNAAGREQVERLIPPRSCLLLVTSRRYFALPGLVTKSLDSLPAEDATALLRRIAPRIGKEADEIARLCGYLPIALRLAGGTLAVRPDLSPAEYARRLAKGKGRLELIEASLGLSYELLSSERQRLWRALAVFPGTFDRAAAAAVWDLDSERADSHLGELVKDGLVEWADGRYRLHDLARCFAESRLDEGEGAEFRCRHARHYVGVLEEAENLYLQGGEGVRTGLSLLDREWANIEAGQAWPELHAEDSPEMAAVCSAYPQAGSHCLWFRLSLPALIRWQETALASARRIGDRRAEGRHLGLLGRAFIASGDSRLSVQLGTEAVEVAREVGDRSGEGINLAFLGVTHYYLGDLHCAVELIEQAVGLSRNAGDCRKEVADLGCLAGVYSDLGERHHAIELYEEALIVARETGNHYAEAGILPSLGFTVARLGDPRRALECYRQALLLVRGIGDRSLECHILDNLADAYTDLGEPRKAIKIADRALSIADEIGNRRQEGQVLTTLGRAFWAIGKQDRAVELWERSRDLGREVGDRRTEGLASWYLGLVHEEAGQLELAADLLKVRVDYERAIGSADAEGLAAKVDEIRARSCGH